MLLWRFKKSVAFTANGNMDLTHAGLQREVIQGVDDNKSVPKMENSKLIPWLCL